MCLLKNKVIFFLLSILLISAGCERRAYEKAPAYFDIDSLIDAQLVLLVQRQPALHKEALIGSDSANVTFTPADSTAWAKELDIFRQLDMINKPVNRDNYEVQDNVADTRSNLKICRYKAKKELPLAYLNIYYTSDHRNVRRIEGLYQEQNALYASSRYLLIELNKVYDDIALTSYQIEGGQKMIMGDSTAFKINGVLTYP